MAALIPQKMFDEQLAAMDIENFAQATIRQVGAVGGALEKNSGTEFLHLEMGVPGLPPETVGVEAEQQALAQGHASIYPSITGIAPLKSEASRFVKAFLDIDVAPEAPFLGLDADKFEAGIRSIFARKGEQIVEINLKAFRAGYEYAQKHRK